LYFESRIPFPKQAALSSALLFSYRPNVSAPERSAYGTLQNRIAVVLILRFTRGMILAIIADSKLCAWDTRHAPVGRLSAARLRSTWQGGGSPLRCILPRAAVSSGSGNRARFRTFGLVRPLPLCGVRP
jgi:hypothetical protein